MAVFLDEILGLLLFLACFLVCIFCIIYGIWRMVTGECYEAYIDEIQYNGQRGRGVHVFRIYVKAYINYTETRLLTSEIFTSSWVYKRKWERLKQKYIGKKVHIYMNPTKPSAQTITRELCWRMFLPIGFAALLFLLLILILGTDLVMEILKII